MTIPNYSLVLSAEEHLAFSLAGIRPSCMHCKKWTPQVGVAEFPGVPGTMILTGECDLSPVQVQKTPTALVCRFFKLAPERPLTFKKIISHFTGTSYE